LFDLFKQSGGLEIWVLISRSFGNWLYPFMFELLQRINTQDCRTSLEFPTRPIRFRMGAWEEIRLSSFLWPCSIYLAGFNPLILCP
jgi:hypothetical protein